MRMLHAAAAAAAAAAVAGGLEGGCNLIFFYNSHTTMRTHDA